MRLLCLLTFVSICTGLCQGQQLHARALRQADLTAAAHAPAPSATLPNQAGASGARSVDLPQMLMLPRFDAIGQVQSKCSLTDPSSGLQFHLEHDQHLQQAVGQCLMVRRDCSHHPG